MDSSLETELPTVLRNKYKCYDALLRKDSFGSFYRILDKDGTKYILREILLDTLEESIRKLFPVEVTISLHLKNNNILEVHEIKVCPEVVYIIMENAESISLLLLLKTLRNTRRRNSGKDQGK